MCGQCLHQQREKEWEPARALGSPAPQHSSGLHTAENSPLCTCSAYCPCIWPAGSAPVALVLCHRAMGLCSTQSNHINIHLFVKMTCPCCSESLQIIHIDPALLMIKYNVLQSLRLTRKLDWIYCFEVGCVVFSYIAFFFPPPPHLCGTLCHFANEELPSHLLLKASLQRIHIVLLNWMDAVLQHPLPPQSSPSQPPAMQGQWVQGVPALGDATLQQIHAHTPPGSANPSSTGARGAQSPLYFSGSLEKRH